MLVKNCHFLIAYRKRAIENIEEEWKQRTFIPLQLIIATKSHFEKYYKILIIQNIEIHFLENLICFFTCVINERYTYTAAFGYWHKFYIE